MKPVVESNPRGHGGEIETSELVRILVASDCSPYSAHCRASFHLLFSTPAANSLQQAYPLTPFMPAPLGTVTAVVALSLRPEKSERTGVMTTCMKLNAPTASRTVSVPIRVSS